MKKFLWLLLILCGVSVAGGALHYHGVCISEGKILSEEEKQYKIAEDLNSWQLDIFRKQRMGVPEGYKQVHYDNAGEFLKMNPACCKTHIYERILQPEGKYMSESSDIDSRKRFSTRLMRILGGYAGEVQAEYNGLFVDEAGDQRKFPIKAWRWIDNCGRVDSD